MDDAVSSLPRAAVAAGEVLWMTLAVCTRSEVSAAHAIILPSEVIHLIILSIAMFISFHAVVIVSEQRKKLVECPHQGTPACIP